MFANYNQTALERMQELIEQLHKAGYRLLSG